MKQGLRTSQCHRNSPQNYLTQYIKPNKSNDNLNFQQNFNDKQAFILKPCDNDNIIMLGKLKDTPQSPNSKVEAALAKRIKNLNQQYQQNNQMKKRNSSSIIKLPNINQKNNKTVDGLIINTADTNISNENALKTGNGKMIGSDKKIFSNETQEKVQDLTNNFLQYINVRPIKPTGRSPQKTADRSIRDVRLNKLQQTIKTNLRKDKDVQSVKKGIKRQRSQQKGLNLKEQHKIVSRDQNRSQQNTNEHKLMSSSTQSDKFMIRTRKTYSINSKTGANSNNTSFNNTNGSSTQQNIAGISNTLAIIDKRKKIRTTYIDFCLFISMMNKMNKQQDPVTTYKAYVGKGNNSVMVKNILKTRFWWNIVSQPDIECNLTWSQGRDNKLIHSMKKFYQQEKSMKNKTKMSFHIKTPNKQDIKFTPIKDYTKYGLSRLVSEEEKQKLSKGDYTVHLPAGEYRNIENPNKTRIHNHLQFNWNLTNKKALFYNLKAYYTAIKQNPFDFIPTTFHIHNSQGNQWDTFEKAYHQRQADLKQKKSDNPKSKKHKNLWIIKPGQNSNQGCGIQVSDSVQQIRQMIRANQQKQNGGKNRSFIVQRYLMPFLYSKRKFDIRHYIMVTSVNSIMKVYWYEEGYIRTSCKEFNMKDLKNKFIHLTNDAVQKKCQQYGKYENGNKVSYPQFQRYLDNTYGQKTYNFYQQVYPKMMKLAADCVRSTLLLLDSNQRQFCFEVYGLDFMIDQQFNTWLIQVNNNPCLSLPTPLQARIIPAMLENAFRIAVDPFFPPPTECPKSKPVPNQLFEANKFTLIFNSADEEGQNLVRVLKTIDVLQQECQQDEQQQNAQQIQ